MQPGHEQGGEGGPGVTTDRCAVAPLPHLALLQPAQSPPPLWPQVQDLFEAEGNDRLKLLVLYSGEDDELLRRAAAGGLAMLTSMRPSLCSRIPQVVSASSWPGTGGLFLVWNALHGPGVGVGAGILGHTGVLRPGLSLLLGGDW